MEKRVRISFFLLFVLNVFTVYSQKDIILKDGWQFCREDFGSIWEVVRFPMKGFPEAVPLWDTVSLPHCYNAFDAVNPYVNYYQGPAWYRTYLDFDNPYPDGRVLLHFEGAGQKAKVYVFKDLAGSHVGGYDEWTVDITDLVKKNSGDPYLKKHYKGKIPVSVRTDNSRDVEMIPSDMSDFNLYGGLYRKVHLIYSPPVYIKGLKIVPQLDEKRKRGHLDIFVSFSGDVGEEDMLEVEIFDSNGEQVAKGSTKAVEADKPVTFEIKRPVLWSPSSPVLYRCKATLRSSGNTAVASSKFGFRSFYFADKGPFYLNGKRLLIRGMSLHEDHAGVGAALTSKQMHDEMVMMKDMGANFVRLGHYQQSREILQLCDSLGILVWEEIPWCRGGLGHEQYREQARRMLRNMITQHYNHPSVIIWGLGNENDWPGDFPSYSRDSVIMFMTELNDLAHQLDPTRVTGIRRCDFCRNIIDVYSPSIWAGWYRGKYTEYKEVSRKDFERVDHFIHMEWGASSHARRHSENPDQGLEAIPTGQGADERNGDASLYGGIARASKDGDWTETYACNLIDWHLKEQETMDWLTGAAYWIFKDFSTPVRPENPIPYVNQKGVVERDNTPKEPYYVFQSYWSDKPMVHIYGHTWPVRWGKKDEQKLIKVYSNCDKAEVFLNGKSLGIKKRVSSDFPAAGLRWTTTFKEGTNHVHVKAYKGKTVVEDEVEFYYETRHWGEPEKVDYTIKQTGRNKKTVEIVVKDKNGVVCLDAKNWARFEYAGAGKMLADMGTYGGSRKIQLANGRAEIDIDTSGGKGVLCVMVEGLKPLFVKVE